MTSSFHFREMLVKRILAQADKVLLRVVAGPDFERPREFTGKDILEHAERITSSLGALNERSVVLLLLPHSAELFLLQVGLVLKGHIPAVLAWPTNRIDAEKYQRNLVYQLSYLPADALITLPRLAGNLGSNLPFAVSGVTLENGAAFERLFPAEPLSERLEAREVSQHPVRPSTDAVFLQFSGGTTGEQKAIVVTAEMLLHQFTQLGEALQFTTEDSVVSWLPLYHDMGLIACYWMPLWHGAASVQISAGDWVLNPELLFKYVDRFCATMCWLPNFAFSYLSQRGDQMQEHRLGSVRAWINCSEPVRRKSLDEFLFAFSGWGVKKECLSASYAMAETVFAITQSEPGRELRTVARGLVRQGNRASGQMAFGLIDNVYVSSGRPIAASEVKIVTADGAICGDRIPGEIYVRTPSLFSGYWGADGFRTHTLNDGWHATGDIGFLDEGELFVIGRLKDIVIVGGNNIFPEDVEAVVNKIPGIHAGRVVAFGVEDQELGTQSLGVVAEMKTAFNEQAALELEAAIRKLVLTAIGTAPRHVAVVPPRWIVKSTAGKISRRETRERYLRERFAIT